MEKILFIDDKKKISNKTDKEQEINMIGLLSLILYVTYENDLIDSDEY